MTSQIDFFVDEMLDDTVRSMMRQRDFERAWNRNECRRINLGACEQLIRLIRNRHRIPLRQPELNNLRGRCAEQRLLRRLCEREFEARNQIRVGPRPGGSVLDTSPWPGARRRLPAGLENKYIHVSAYRDAAGRIQTANIVGRVRGHVEQVRRHMRQSAAPGARPGLPAQVRLFYQLGGRISEPEFQQLSRALYQAVAAANRQASGPQVRATVVRSSRFPFR
jgi:hypothetical protein